MNIQQLAEKAYQLRGALHIWEHRQSIEKIFKLTNDNDIADIKLRLVVVDSLFSTNAAKTPRSLDDMAKYLSEISDLQEVMKQFLQGDTKADESLFDQKFGTKSKRHKSLMSKYLFFANNQQFPILDSNVKKFVSALYQKFPLVEQKPKDQYSLQYLEKFIAEVKLQDNTQTTKYDLCDALAWVYEKIEDKSINFKNEEISEEECLAFKAEVDNFLR